MVDLTSQQNIASRVEREKPAPRHGGIVRSAVTAVLVLLLAVLGLKIAFSAVTSAAIFAFPFQFDESEGMIVAETMLLDQGVNIFEHPTPSLFVAAPYPPLFYLLNWPMQRLAGDEPTFKGGRALSLLALLLAATAIFGIVLRMGRDRVAAAVGAGVWLALGVTGYWGSLVKPDMLAVALGLLGLWLILVRGPDKPWWALAFFLAAFFTKQTTIAAGAATCAWLLVQRPRTGLLFGVAYAAGAIVPTWLLDAATRGGYWYHLITVHDLPWFPERFGQFIGFFLSTYGLFALPAGVVFLWLGLVYVSRRLRGRDPGQGESYGLLLPLYLLVAVLAATGTGTLGGNHNHLLELAVATSLGVGLALALLRGLPDLRGQLASGALGLLLLVQSASLFETPAWLQRELSLLSASKTEGMMNIFQYVTNNGGTAYSDNTGLMLSTRKKLWTTDPFTQTHATFYGRWDESLLVRAIEAGEFAQIILRIDVFDPADGAGDVSPGVLQAVRNRYKLDQRNVENIYVPR